MLTTLTSAVALKLVCVAARGAASTALLETRTQRPSLAIHGEVVEALLLHAHWGEALEGLLAAMAESNLLPGGTSCGSERRGVRRASACV